MRGGFVACYSPDTGHTLDKSFFSREDNGNPYDWESDYGKYLWLKEHGLTSKQGYSSVTSRSG